MWMGFKQNLAKNLGDKNNRQSIAVKLPWNQNLREMEIKIVDHDLHFQVESLKVHGKNMKNYSP